MKPVHRVRSGVRLALLVPLGGLLAVAAAVIIRAATLRPTEGWTAGPPAASSTPEAADPHTPFAAPEPASPPQAAARSDPPAALDRPSATHGLQASVARETVERFAGSLRFATVSHGDRSLFDPAPFEGLRAYLRDAFPLVHEDLRAETVGGQSMLYTWTGSDPSLPPVILLAHSDVVPVEPGTEEDWRYPPFSGTLAGGAVWGRGAMDDKASLLAILQAAEGLLEEGFRPTRTFHFVFGHDEEIGGREGAGAVASLLETRGVRAAYVLDEGMAIVEESIPGIPGPVALIGIAEKGYLSLSLRVEVEGGHSSTPPPETAVGILAGAVSRLEANPFPVRLEGPSRMLLSTLAPHMDFPMRLVTGNLWLFAPLVAREMAKIPAMNAAVRTTTAPTLLRAGVKDNILPSKAEAVVNFRLLPGDSVEDVRNHAIETVGDPRVEIQVYQDVSTEPSSVSSTEGRGYREIEETVQEVFPGTLVAPFLTLGGTDSKHFAGVAKDVYRFAPIRYLPDLAPGVHGTDERIPEEHYLDMVRFYRRLIERAGGG